MKSSSNQYYAGLDHIRMLAALLVFSWHFLHSPKGQPIPFEYVATLPGFSLFNEGHIGVSLFMVLSGYLFSKIINQRSIDYTRFYINRFLRLAPLMIFVVLVNGVLRAMNGEPSLWYIFASLANGLVYPSLPNSGWSITVEFHFYLLLPFLLILARKSALGLFGLILLCVGLRYAYYLETGSIRYLSYWTILGRIDLFVFGMLAFLFSSHVTKPRRLIFSSLAMVSLLYWWFDSVGGYKGTGDHAIWSVLSTAEGLFLAIFVASYDIASKRFDGTISRAAANIGKYSYSMYLMHMFFVFQMSDWINQHVLELSNFYLALGFSFIAFLSLVPIAFLSYTFVEKPFLRYRVTYFKTPKTCAA